MALINMLITLSLLVWRADMYQDINIVPHKYVYLLVNLEVK